MLNKRIFILEILNKSKKIKHPIGDENDFKTKSSRIPTFIQSYYNLLSLPSGSGYNNFTIQTEQPNLPLGLYASSSGSPNSVTGYGYASNAFLDCGLVNAESSVGAFSPYGNPDCNFSYPVDTYPNNSMNY